MPRNGAGVYSLPAGNPVEPDTLIESVWANDTMNDIADELTNSLTRNGAGGMTGPFRVTNGSAAAPAIAFTSETTLGFYRVSAGVLGVGVGSTLRLSVSAAEVEVNTDLDVNEDLNVDGNAVVVGTLGVTGNVAINTDKFTVAAATGNTVIAGNLAVAGSLTFTGALDVAGNFSVATNKFTVAAATGNTVIAGTLGVVDDFGVGSPNKFFVDGPTGNTSITGTLAVAGAVAFATTLAVAQDFAINTDKFTVSAASGNTFIAGDVAISGDLDVAGALSFAATNVDGDFSVATNKFTVAAASGNTTVAGTLSVTGAATLLDSLNVQGMIQTDPAGGSSYIEVGFRDIPLTTTDSNSSFALTDRGKGWLHSSASTHTWTIPANASVAFPVGSAISGVNTGAGALSIAITSDTLVNAADGSTGTVTIPQHGTFTLWKVASTTWYISASQTS